MTFDEAIALLQAAKDGKVIQYKDTLTGAWYNDPSDLPDCFNFARFQYRVKPEPKEIWVNEYTNRFIGHSSADSARASAVDRAADRIAVKYREVIDE